MASKEELYGWLFVTTIPLLCEEKKLERQQKIETWLDLYQLTRELDIAKNGNGASANSPIDYVT
ncbi:hypothetical protein G4O51_11295 [Candidatus Bathyarchaeota archaeon A05DMB-2]|nr:hypothetical protein [Candidatus Bathyarchaeota archaeon A05DMB-2]